MGTDVSPSCWIDAFELSRYRGRRRRIFGPAHFVSVRSRTEPWGITIDSMIVGPKAFVRLYKSLQPTKTVLWLVPKQKIEDLAEFRVDDEVDSIQVRDRAPIEGEPGYEAFMQLIARIKKARGSRR